MKLILLFEETDPYGRLYEISLNPNIKDAIQLLQDMTNFTNSEYVKGWIYDFKVLWRKIITKLDRSDKTKLFRYIQTNYGIQNI